MSKTREERIRERAYDLWEREGGQHGRHDTHWKEAEAEIEAEDRSLDPQFRDRSAAPAVPERPPAKPAAENRAVATRPSAKATPNASTAPIKTATRRAPARKKPG